MSEEPKSLIQQACDLAIERLIRRLAMSVEDTTPAQGERIEMPTLSEPERPLRNSTHHMVLSHLKIAQSGLDQIYRGIGNAGMLRTSDPVLISRSDVMEAIEHIGRSIWAARDLLEHDK